MARKVNTRRMNMDFKKHIPQYNKNQDWQARNLYNSLKEHTEQALTNVLNLPPINHSVQNTATSIHELVKIF